MTTKITTASSKQILNFKQQNQFMDEVKKWIKQGIDNQRIAKHYYGTVTQIYDDVYADISINYGNSSTLLTHLANKSGVILQINDVVLLTAPFGDISDIYIDKNSNKVSFVAGSVLAPSVLLNNSTLDIQFTNLDSTLDSATTRITTAETTIIQNTNSIALKASQTSLDTTNSNVTGVTTRMTTAESNITIQAGQISTKVDVAGVKSTIQQSASDVQIAFNAINAAKVTFDATGLIVDGGSYRIKDIGGAEYTVTSDSNMVNDHSFELVGTSGSVDATHDDFAVVSNGNAFMWNASGTPRLVSNANRSYINGLPEFGLKAIACTSANYIMENIMVQPSTVYTLSGYAKPHPTRNVAGSTIIANFYVKYLDSSGVQISTVTVNLTLTTNHSSSNVNLNLKRHKYTFTTPSNCVTVLIVPFSANTGWVIWDGMQLIKGDYPSLYNPENQLWNYINQYYGFPITPQTWTTPTLLNGWINFDPSAASCQYMKDSMGFVHLKGLVKNGVIGAVLFTLPVGYRPAENQHFGTASNNAYGQSVVYSTGDIRLDIGSNVWVTISGITFKAGL